MALNTLLEIYTEKSTDNPQKLVYVKGTPEKIVKMIENSMNFLAELMRNPKTPL